jgi:hypothetical protein
MIIKIKFCKIKINVKNNPHFFYLKGSKKRGGTEPQLLIISPRGAPALSKK